MNNDELEDLILNASYVDGYTRLDFEVTGKKTENSLTRVHYRQAFFEMPENIYDPKAENISVETASYLIKKDLNTPEDESRWYCEDWVEHSEKDVSINEFPRESDVVTAWKSSIEHLVNQDVALEYFDYPETMPTQLEGVQESLITEMCREALAGWSPEAEPTFIKPREFKLIVMTEPAQLIITNGLIPLPTLLSDIGAVIVDGQPRIGGTHTQFKGYGFNKKLAHFRSDGNNVYEARGVFDGKQTSRHCRLIDGLNAKEAESLIDWTDAGVGLIIDATGMARGYRSSKI